MGGAVSLNQDRSDEKGPEVMSDLFAFGKAYRLITDIGGTRHLVDGGGVRYFTEEEPGLWAIAVSGGNWAAWQAIAESLRQTPEPEQALPVAAESPEPEIKGQLPLPGVADVKDATTRKDQSDER